MSRRVRLAPAYDWLERLEKHPTPIRQGGATWWRWRWQFDGEDIDTLPVEAARRLPRGDSPRGNTYSTRRRALAAAAEAVTAAAARGWIPPEVS